jgi:hypothetical protein
MEKVFKIHVDLNLQTLFSSIIICILGGMRFFPHASLLIVIIIK